MLLQLLRVLGDQVVLPARVLPPRPYLGHVRVEILGLAVDVVLQLVVDHLQVHQAIHRPIYLLPLQQADCLRCVLKPLAGLVVEAAVDYLHGDVPPILVVVLVVIPVFRLGREARVLRIIGLHPLLQIL